MIQKQLIDELALRLLEGEFAEGDAVKVDAKDGELTFAKASKRKKKAARSREGRRLAGHRPGDGHACHGRRISTTSLLGRPRLKRAWPVDE